MISYETLWAIPGMTEARISELFAAGKTPTEVAIDLPSSELVAFKRLVPEVAAYLDQRRGFSLCVYGDYQYPAALRDAKYPVDLFYYQGDLSLVENKCISIVGARSASSEGQSRAARLAKELVSAGYTIVSGLAVGIDTAALDSAINSKGNVIGVIGTPIDQFYPNPSENKNLQARIAQNHLLISQVPFFRYNHEPFKQRAHYFPRRNATMSAISKATIIVEASEKSGTLTQARAALQQGRHLFILNSCFDNPAISWPAYYQKNGAIRVRESSEIIARLEAENP